MARRGLLVLIVVFAVVHSRPVSYLSTYLLVTSALHEYVGWLQYRLRLAGRD